MGYFPVRYDSRVVIYERKMFIRLVTGLFVVTGIQTWRYAPICLRSPRLQSYSVKPPLSFHLHSFFAHPKKSFLFLFLSLIFLPFSLSLSSCSFPSFCCWHWHTTSHSTSSPEHPMNRARRWYTVVM